MYVDLKKEKDFTLSLLGCLYIGGYVDSLGSSDVLVGANCMGKRESDLFWSTKDRTLAGFVGSDFVVKSGLYRVVLNNALSLRRTGAMKMSVYSGVVGFKSRGSKLSIFRKLNIHNIYHSEV